MAAPSAWNRPNNAMPSKGKVAAPKLAPMPAAPAPPVSPVKGAPRRKKLL